MVNSKVRQGAGAGILDPFRKRTCAPDGQNDSTNVEQLRASGAQVRSLNGPKIDAL
jgi:hypothetical protein